MGNYVANNTKVCPYCGSSEIKAIGTGHYIGVSEPMDSEYMKCSYNCCVCNKDFFVKEKNPFFRAKYEFRVFFQIFQQTRKIGLIINVGLQR